VLSATSVCVAARDASLASLDEDEHASQRAKRAASEESSSKKRAVKSEQQKACYPQLVYVLLARDASLASLDENEHTRDESTPAKMLQT